MKHKHCELIKAWADGAEIQYKTEDGEWFDWYSNDHPAWSDVIEYRIKPEEKKPVVRWLWTNDEKEISKEFLTEEETKFLDWTIKLEWSRTEFPE